MSKLSTSRALPLIVISQFCCTSLWFAGNGVMGELVNNFQLEASALSHLTSAVQLGFISGTLTFALLTIADRFPPSLVFMISALVAACFNAMIIWEGNQLPSLLAWRFLTGFFLAGIYPVGMKISADYYETGLGKSLGYLVGALVIGTAFPHFLNGFTIVIPWRLTLIITSVLATGGGLLLLIFVPSGPYRKPSPRLDLSAFLTVFRNTRFRAAAFGYFGHMWELYAFWAFVPLILTTYVSLHPEANLNISFWSFSIIGSGGLACVIAGYLSLNFDTKKIASLALLLSCLCCVISPWLFHTPYSFLFIGFLLFWGMTVIADSPLFSTLVANNALAETKGTALTIVNCIGFSITIVSIQLLNALMNIMDPRFIYTLLALGPLLGLLALYRQK